MQATSKELLQALGCTSKQWDIVHSLLKDGHSKDHIQEALMAEMRPHALNSFLAQMDKRRLWANTDHNPEKADSRARLLKIRSEMEARLWNLQALPEDAQHEKLLNRLILKVLLELDPQLKHEDYSAQTRNVKLEEGLVELRRLTEQRNRMLPQTLHHFQRAEKCLSEPQALLHELLAIELKLQRLNVLRLRGLVQANSEAAQVIRGGKLLLLTEPCPALEALLAEQPLPAEPRLSVVRLPEQNLLMGRLPPSMDETEADLALLAAVQAVRECSAMVVVQPIDRELHTLGLGYLEAICDRLAHLLPTLAHNPMAVAFVLVGYGEEQALENLKEQTRLLLNNGHKGRAGALNNLQLALKDPLRLADREPLLGRLISALGPSELLHRPGVRSLSSSKLFCEELFRESLHQLGEGNVDYAKYLVRGLEFVGALVGDTGAGRMCQQVKSRLRRLPRKVYIGMDGTSSMSVEYKGYLKDMLLQLLDLKNQHLQALGLPADHIQLKIVFYTNYSSGRAHLRQSSSFVSQAEEVRDFLEGFKNHGGQGHEAVEVLYHQLLTEKHVDMLAIFADARANTLEETKRNREKLGPAEWAGSEFEELWDADKEAEAIVARGIPIYAFYEGRDCADYFSQLARRSGGAAYECKTSQTDQTLQQLFQVMTGLVCADDLL